MSISRIVSLCFAHLLAFVSIDAIAQDAEGISLGRRHQLQSRFMGETRSVFVHVPADYAFSLKRYPLVIVLDGDDQFAHTSTTVDFLAQGERIPEMIVVGVPNTNRARDLNAATSRGLPPATGGGGPEKFLAFIAEELIPDIEHRYRTAPYRVITGHSNGALFAIYALNSRPELFNGYILASPAFNDGDGLSAPLGSMLIANTNRRADLFMSMANERGQNMGGAFEIASVLQEKASRDFRWQFRRYPEETHGSVSARTVYDGLQVVFDGWYIHEPLALFEAAGLDGLDKHYAAVSTRANFAVPVPERVLLAIFNSLESRARLDEADRVVSRALELYPDSAYAHFYAGRLYQKMGSKQRAIEHLKKSLLLSPSFGAPRSLLKELNVEIASIIPEFQLSKGAISALVGGYGSSSVDLEIVEREGVLYSKTPRREYALSAMSETKLYYQTGEDVLIFNKGRSGRIDGLTFQGKNVELRKLR